MKSNLQILLTSVSKQNSRWGHSYVVAFTSSLPGEGVTHVVSAFAGELGTKTQQRVIVADSETLQKVSIANKKLTRFVQTSTPNIFVLEGLEGDPETYSGGMELIEHAPRSSVERAVTNLQALRYAFDFVLIDCSSISDSSDAAFLAHAADGVVLVVEANRTHESSVRESLKTINLANGNLLGCVLNRRRYPVPNWIYKRL